MEHMTGLSSEEVLGRKALELFPHLQEQGVDRLLARELKGETVHTEDIPFTHQRQGRKAGSGEFMGRTGAPLERSSASSGRCAILPSASRRRQKSPTSPLSPC